MNNLYPQLANLPVLDLSERFDEIGYVYYLFHDDLLIYIGQSIKLQSRIEQHRKDKYFNRVQYRTVARDILTDIESREIAYYKPILNTAGKPSVGNKYMVHNGYLHIQSKGSCKYTPGKPIRSTRNSATWFEESTGILHEYYIPEEANSPCELTRTTINTGKVVNVFEQEDFCDKPGIFIFNPLTFKLVLKGTFSVDITQPYTYVHGDFDTEVSKCTKVEPPVDNRFGSILSMPFIMRNIPEKTVTDKVFTRNVRMLKANYTFCFGKYKGLTVDHIRKIEGDSDYVGWVSRNVDLKKQDTLYILEPL